MLTVLTTPVLPVSRRLYQALRGAARTVVKPGAPRPRSSRYPGHYALVRSVVEGLRTIDADFNFNPRRFGELARVVYAPANEALRQAIGLKRRGAVDFLVAGPVNALLADESDGILLTPEIDLVIVPSAWTVDLYQGFPALIEKCRVCPCGVDAEAWQPSGRPREKTAVVYWKSGDEPFCEAVEAIVRRCGLEPIRITSRHGDHTIFRQADYREALSRSVVGIFLSTFETQGIALAEAWSMDVPAVVWDPKGDAEWRGRTFQSRSSAPFLTPATGVTFKTTDDLEAALRQSLADRAAFAPREWVLRHMTDAICAERLYGLIRREAARRQRARSLQAASAAGISRASTATGSSGPADAGGALESDGDAG
jgi:glycosyltransferase involved in cell wall biosynthesis